MLNTLVIISKANSKLSIFFKLILVVLLYLSINPDIKAASSTRGIQSAMLNSCAVVYEHSNYRGRNFNLCLGQHEGFDNESHYSYARGFGITSFKIPEDAALIACTYNGQCETYFNSVRNLSYEMNDKIQSIRILRFKYSDFITIIASDPQYPWSCRNYTEDCSNRTIANADNHHQVRVMNNIKQKNGRHRVAGVIINGDLTAYGHADELNKYREFFESKLQMSSFPGLGNHDYENNVHNSFNEDNPSRMLEYLAHKVDTLRVRDIDLSYNGMNRNGSYSYSWDIADVYFI